MGQNLSQFTEEELQDYQVSQHLTYIGLGRYTFIIICVNTNVFILFITFKFKRVWLI